MDVLDYYGDDEPRINLGSSGDDIDSETLEELRLSTAGTDEEGHKKPLLPDESKWDIVYCLPFFAKPGKHTYMVKFKNTKEKY